MGIDPEIAKQWTPGEFEAFTRGWAHSRYRGFIGLAVVLGEGTKNLAKILFPEDKAEDEDDEVLAISMERARKARLKKRKGDAS